MSDEETAARLRWQAAQAQLEESILDYASCKDFGTNASVFTAAVVLSEACVLEKAAHEAYDEIVMEAFAQEIAAERAAAG